MFYYKKDDWRQWAHPMIYAILDDIVMLEKMRLADMSALDGAISNIRLWTLGNLDHKILPNKSAINKLRDILASNVGGGTMELVWGPELSFQESSSEVYKFLGSEKYTAVLNSIYAGLGVPPTLTGMAGNGGGFTNNFISLKTLVERLQYGRDQLTRFWEKELEIIRKSMGFRYKAHVQFDRTSLSDEAAEKNLLIQLADRDIISHETLLERFKEIPQVESIRLKRELNKRDTVGPEKAGPFHAPSPPEVKEPSEEEPTPETETPANTKDTPTIMQEGRPRFKQDEKPRKKRTETPKSTPGLASVVVHAEKAWSHISDTLTNSYIKSLEKKNLRQLTKAEFRSLEQLKIDVFSNISLEDDISDNLIHTILVDNSKASKEFMNKMDLYGVKLDDMSIEDYRKHIVGIYIEVKS